MISTNPDKAYLLKLVTGERLVQSMTRWRLSSVAMAAALVPCSAGAVSLNQVLIDNFLIDDGGGIVDPGNMLRSFECTSANSVNVVISFTSPFEGSFESMLTADEVIDECADFDGDSDGDDGEEEPEDEEPDDDGEADPPANDDAEARDRAEIIDQLVDFGVTLVPGAFNPNAIAVLNIPPLNNNGQLLAGIAAENPAVRACQNELNRLRDQFQALQDEKQRLAGPPPQPDDITEGELQEDPDFRQLADARLSVQAFTKARETIKARLDSREALINELNANGTIDRKLTEENANSFGRGDPALVQAGRGNDDRIRGIQSAAAAEFGILVATRVATAGAAQLAGFSKSDGFEFEVSRDAARRLTRGLAASPLSSRTAKAIKRAKQGFKGSKKGTGEAEKQSKTDQRTLDNQEVKDALFDATLEIAPGALNPLEIIDQFTSIADRLDALRAASDGGEIAAQQAQAEALGIKRDTLNAVIGAIAADAVLKNGAFASGGLLAIDGTGGSTQSGTSQGEALFNFAVDFLGVPNLVAQAEETLFGGQITLGGILRTQFGLLLRQHLAFVGLAKDAEDTLARLDAEFRRRALNRRLAERDDQLAEAQRLIEKKAQEIADKQIACEKLAGIRGSHNKVKRPIFEAMRLDAKPNGATAYFNLAEFRADQASQGVSQSLPGVLGDRRFNMWLTPGFSFQDGSGPNNLSGVSLRVTGGASWSFAPEVNVGVTASFSHADLDGIGDNKSDANAFTIGLFTQSRLPQGFSLTALAAYTRADISSTVNGVSGSTDQEAFTGQIALSNSIDLYETRLTPSLSATYVHLKTDAFRDSAGGFNAAAKLDQFSIGAGLSASRRFKLSNGRTLTPRLGVNGFLSTSHIKNDALDAVGLGGRNTSTGVTLGGGFSYHDRTSGLTVGASGSLAGITRGQQVYSVGLNFNLPFQQ